MLKRIVVILLVVSIAMLIALLIMTSPSTAGPLGILGFFVFLYTLAMSMLTFAFYAISIAVVSLTPSKRKRLIMKPLSFKLAYYYASVLALAPVMLIAMRSVGEIGIYQVLLVSLFIVVAWVYVTNRTA